MMRFVQVVDYLTVHGCLWPGGVIDGVVRRHLLHVIAVIHTNKLGN